VAWRCKHVNLLLTFYMGIWESHGVSEALRSVPGWFLRWQHANVTVPVSSSLWLTQGSVPLRRWANSHSPYHPFMAGYYVRLAMAVLLIALVAAFPPDATTFTHHFWPFFALSAIGLVTSFTSTLMFTAIGSFFNRVSDPDMGGAYLTLLNTIANMGIILPKTPLFYLMDVLTTTRCVAVDGSSGSGALEGLVCPKKPRVMAGVNECTSAGGVCEAVSDGFYVVGLSLAAAGVLLGLLYVRLFPALVALPLDRWRAAARKQGVHSS
jgi:PAT family acetyl-CoA transporter-like MFS transporter 1